MRELQIVTDGIRLGQFLKLAGFADSGADAKALLESGQVRVNAERDIRRGRQLIRGDVIDARGESVRLR